MHSRCVWREGHGGNPEAGFPPVVSREAHEDGVPSIVPSTTPFRLLERRDRHAHVRGGVGRGDCVIVKLTSLVGNDGALRQWLRVRAPERARWLLCARTGADACLSCGRCHGREGTWGALEWRVVRERLCTAAGAAVPGGCQFFLVVLSLRAVVAVDVWLPRGRRYQHGNMGAYSGWRLRCGRLS